MPAAPTAVPPAVRINARPYLHGPEAEAAASAIAAGQYGHGPLADQFESELAAYLDVPDVVVVSSATVGIHLALMTCGLRPGDEVIVPSQTFAATIQPITALGAVPRFIDHDPDTLCIGPHQVLQAITPATRVVLPVLYGGRPVDLSSIWPQLHQQGICIVQDAAQAFGSRREGTLVGADPQVTTVLSFGPIKQVTALVGGAVVPRSAKEAAALRCTRALGITSSQGDRIATTTYTVDRAGLRGTLSEVNAAVGRVQLERFEHTVAPRRIELWRQYARALANIPGVSLVDVGLATGTVPFNCVVRIPARDAVHRLLHDLGIGVGVHYPPNHLQPAFAPWRRRLPETERAAGEILSLPFHPAMTGDDAHYVAAALHRALAAVGHA